MASPTAPTLSSIVTEALNRAGYTSIPSGLNTRAQNQWMEEVKNDIWNTEKRLRSLHTESVAVLTAGQSRYSNPSGYAVFDSMQLLKGTYTGTSTAGSLGQLTLASSLDVATTYMLGKELVITSGVAQGSYSQITGWDNTNKIASVTPNFQTNPSDTPTYLIADEYVPLPAKNVLRYDEKFDDKFNLSEPEECYIIGDEDYGEFYLYPTPDNTHTYAVKMRFFLDLPTLDLASTRMATLYRRWRSVMVQGIYTKALENKDDSRYPKAFDTYWLMLNSMIDNNERFIAEDVDDDSVVEGAYIYGINQLG